MGMDDRPGDTYDKIINGYLVTMKNHDNTCGIMKGSSYCSCGADDYNNGVISVARTKPPKNPPDKLTFTYDQLVEKITKAAELIKNLNTNHDSRCPTKIYALGSGFIHDGKFTEEELACRCNGDENYKKLMAARKLLSLE